MLRHYLKRWRARHEPLRVIQQVGALPYAMVGERMAFLLVTSRRSGRWIFPKGAIEPDLTAWDSAALEAFEEAGVRGIVERAPIGTYRAIAGATGNKLVDIDLYPLCVTEQLDSWKEQHQRLRHWVTLEEACRLLDNQPLARLVTQFHDSQLRRRRA